MRSFQKDSSELIEVVVELIEFDSSEMSNHNAKVLTHISSPFLPKVYCNKNQVLCLKVQKT